MARNPTTGVEKVQGGNIRGENCVGWKIFGVRIVRVENNRGIIFSNIFRIFFEYFSNIFSNIFEYFPNGKLVGAWEHFFHLFLL